MLTCPPKTEPGLVLDWRLKKEGEANSQEGIQTGAYLVVRNQVPCRGLPALDGVADTVIDSRFSNIHNNMPRYRMSGIKFINFIHNLGASVKTSDAKVDSEHIPQKHWIQSNLPLVEWISTYKRWSSHT